VPVSSKSQQKSESSRAIEGSAAALFDIMASLKDPSEVERFLTDLCTPQEIRALSERWNVARLLDAGNLSYREISKETGVSTATIARVARFLAHEPHQGYRLMLDRLHRRHRTRG